MEETDGKFHSCNFWNWIWLAPLTNGFYFLTGVVTHGDHQSQYLMGEPIEKALVVDAIL